ncbi:MAG: putative toxin-antitoxin system toxin component, PIN family [Nitrospiraceae bacterium]
MRAVADTNVVVSAFLWNGTPRRVLEAAEKGKLELFTSPALIAELEDVLLREKFAERLRRTRFTPAFLLSRFTQLATLIAPTETSTPSLRDRDDEAVLACALAARAELIVSGDDDLRTLGGYRGIAIVSPAECLLRVPA